jgi:hypothetical protein
MRIIYILFATVILSANSAAQLSPGDLAQPHLKLEGLKNCTKCHEIGEKVSAEKCLDCHHLLRDRIVSNKGLHALPGYDNCVLCHSDHHGKNYELIFWKEGQDNFDHSKTGYELKDKHRDLKCRQCHQVKNIKDSEKFEKYNKNLDKTFLGLEQNCLSCHSDQHRGQLSQDCLTCHRMNGWKPAPNFDHNQARFKLIGKHQSVPCASCHPRLMDESSADKNGYLNFSGLVFDNCNDCHKDPHNNRLGEQCTQCHTTSGWKGITNKSFDHNKTRFPLRGKHKNLICEKCHTQSRSLARLQYKVCINCHSDYHQGQFVHRLQKGACEECHTVDGFLPANFTVDMHNQSKYPLEGAHLAVPCNFCHQKTYNNTLRFRFEITACNVCHTDPHKGTADRYVVTQKPTKIQDTCQYCHSVQSWQTVTYDHSVTDFKLEGKHTSVRCKSCHQEGQMTEGSGDVKFKIGKKECLDCHHDIHMGQFSISTVAEKQKTGSVQCDRCHKPFDWSAVNFNHNRDSRFDLKGAHQKLPCSQCHKTMMINGINTVLYKPLEVTCNSCHVRREMNQEG